LQEQLAVRKNNRKFILHSGAPFRKIFASMKQPRRIPAHSAQQRDSVLRLLKEAKARGQGLRRDDAIFAHRIT
jgi:hypothetical protein